MANAMEGMPDNLTFEVRLGSEVVGLRLFFNDESHLQKETLQCLQKLLKEFYAAALLNQYHEEARDLDESLKAVESMERAVKKNMRRRSRAGSHRSLPLPMAPVVEAEEKSVDSHVADSLCKETFDLQAPSSEEKPGIEVVLPSSVEVPATSSTTWCQAEKVTHDANVNAEMSLKHQEGQHDGNEKDNGFETGQQKKVAEPVVTAVVPDVEAVVKPALAEEPVQVSGNGLPPRTQSRWNWRRASLDEARRRISGMVFMLTGSGPRFSSVAPADGTT